MAIAFVQSLGVTVSWATNPSWTSGNITTTSGNLIVIGVEYYDSGDGASGSITDNKSNTWYLAKEQRNSSNRVQIYYAYNITGGSSHNFTFHTSPDEYFSFVIQEFSGIQTGSDPLDKTAAASGADSGNTATTTVADELLVGAIANRSAVATVGTGYSNFDSGRLTVADYRVYIESQIVASTGAYNATFSGSADGQAVTAIATFKGAPTPVNVSITQVAANVTATGGTQTVASVNIVAISQSAANVTANGGTQVVAAVSYVTVDQVAGVITATGGIQLVGVIASISQVAGTLTATGGDQTVDTSNYVNLAQLAGTITATGGTQVVDTVNIISVSQLAGNITATGGTQSITAKIVVSITQLAGNITATGGTQQLAIRTGHVNRWNGSAWVSLPVKVWNGSAWVAHPLKKWAGTVWLLVK